MGGKRDTEIPGVDWYPSSVGEIFILVMLNGFELLQRVNHFEDRTHWGSGDLSFAEAARTATEGLPRWYMSKMSRP